MKAQKERRSSATFSGVGNDQKNREEDNKKGDVSSTEYA
jgi:hypothetical protein